MTSDLFRRADFENFVLGLPAVTLVHQWRDDSVAKVGGKIFSLFDRDDGEVWFKASPMAFAVLPDTPGIRPAPYFARAGWLAVSRSSGMTQEDLAAHIREAHRLVVARLPRRIRSELQLT